MFTIRQKNFSDYYMTSEERAFCEGYEYAQREFGIIEDMKNNYRAKKALCVNGKQARAMAKDDGEAELIQYHRDDLAKKLREDRRRRDCLFREIKKNVNDMDNYYSPFTVKCDSDGKLFDLEKAVKGKDRLIKDFYNLSRKHEVSSLSETLKNYNLLKKIGQHK